jgi:molecular chaperone GrpE (heat shock protein)
LWPFPPVLLPPTPLDGTGFPAEPLSQLIASLRALGVDPGAEWLEAFLDRSLALSEAPEEGTASPGGRQQQQQQQQQLLAALQKGCIEEAVQLNPDAVRRWYVRQQQQQQQQQDQQEGPSSPSSSSPSSSSSSPPAASSQRLTAEQHASLGKEQPVPSGGERAALDSYDFDLDAETGDGQQLPGGFPVPPEPSKEEEQEQEEQEEEQEEEQGGGRQQPPLSPQGSAMQERERERAEGGAEWEAEMLRELEGESLEGPLGEEESDGEAAAKAEQEAAFARELRRVVQERFEAAQRQVAKAEAAIRIARERQAVAAASPLVEKLTKMRRDMENAAQRASRERTAAYDQAVSATVSNLLPLLDNFERASASLRPSTAGERAVQAEYERIKELLDAVLGQYGVAALPCEGLPFDPLVHEAVMQEQNDQVSLEDLGGRTFARNRTSFSSGPITASLAVCH